MRPSLSALLIALLAGFPAPTTLLSDDTGSGAAEPECAKWSIKGLRLSMPLRDVKSQHRKLKHGKNRFRPDNRGKAWYFWAESRMKGIYNYVLPEYDSPDAEIISIVVLVDVSEVSTSDVIRALVERWGEPGLREAPIATARYYSLFGAPRGEFDWTATSWEAPECDLLATLIDKTKMAPPGSIVPPFKEVTLSLDSISKLVEKQEQDAGKAHGVVPP